MSHRVIPKVSIFKFLKHSARILKNPLPFHHANFERLGNTFQLQIGIKQSVYFSRDAGFLQYVLQKNQRNYTKSKIQTKDLAKYVGRGLLTAEGKHWQKQRKMIQPAFHKKQLEGLLDKMQRAITTEIFKIQNNAPTDIFPILNDLAFQTVAKALFSGGVSEDQVRRLQDITETAQKMLVRELRQPYKIWWFKLTGKISGNIALVGEARNMIQELINARRASGQREDDLLDMLLEARYEDGSQMETSQLIDEILILFTAGHETTSNALTFTAQLLAKHPEIKERVFQEIMSVKAETSEGMEIIKRCTLTKQVIEESMRLYPPAYFMDRVNLEDDNFEGMHFKKGASLLFSLYEIHRDPTFWEAPESFNPDRFTGKNPKEFSSHYFPFGAGPRMCIGNNFAMYEMVLTMVTMLENFRIEEKKSPIEITPLITLKPKSAILKFQKRS